MQILAHVAVVLREFHGRDGGSAIAVQRLMRRLAMVLSIALSAGLVSPPRASAQDQSQASRASELGALGVLGVLVVGELLVDAAHLILEPSGAWLLASVTEGEPRRAMAAVELGLGLLEWAAASFALAWRTQDPDPWEWSPAVATPLFAAGLVHVVLGIARLTSSFAEPPVAVGVGADAHGAWLSVGGTID